MMKLDMFKKRDEAGTAVRAVRLTRRNIRDVAEELESVVNGKLTRISPMDEFGSPGASAHVGQWLVLYRNLDVYKYWPDEFNRRFAAVGGGEEV